LLLVFFGALVGGVMFVCSDHPMIATFGVALGMAATLGYLLYRRAQHVKLLQEQLPPALDMLARSIRAGESIDQAMDLVGSRSPQPLAAEFRYCAKQLAMGLSMSAVMRSLVGRVRLTDMRIFTTTLTVHRRTGGNLAQVLQRLAVVVRQRLNYRRQLRSTTGAGRFSAILIACIGPLLFCYLLFVHPEYMEKMLTSPMGQSLLTLAFVLEVVGMIWTARLLKPTY
jgi:tight adherence protein B